MRCTWRRSTKTMVTLSSQIWSSLKLLHKRFLLCQKLTQISKQLNRLICKTQVDFQLIKLPLPNNQHLRVMWVPLINSKAMSTSLCPWLKMLHIEGVRTIAILLELFLCERHPTTIVPVAYLILSLHPLGPCLLSHIKLKEWLENHQIYLLLQLVGQQR